MLNQLDDNSKINWVSEVRTLLFHCGFTNVWIAQDVGNADLFLLNFEQTLKDIYLQTGHASVISSDYLFKTYFMYEKIYNTSK